MSLNYRNDEVLNESAEHLYALMVYGWFAYANFNIEMRRVGANWNVIKLACWMGQRDRCRCLFEQRERERAAGEIFDVDAPVELDLNYPHSRNRKQHKQQR